MPVYDFRCHACGHKHQGLVPYSEKDNQVCPVCGGHSKHVWLSAPHLDWSGMAQGENAGPEFIDRFEKSHKKRAEQEKAYKREHGDDMRLAGS